MPTTMPRILIVDDEREITEILADLLSEDYECLKRRLRRTGPRLPARRPISVGDQRHHHARHERTRDDPARQTTLARHRRGNDQRHADGRERHRRTATRRV